MQRKNYELRDKPQTRNMYYAKNVMLQSFLLKYLIRRKRLTVNGDFAKPRAEFETIDHIERRVP